MKRPRLAERFEFTAFRQTDERTFAFQYTVYFANGAIERFTEKLEFPFAIKQIDKTATKILRQIHLVLGINYYKLHAAPKVVVPHRMDEVSASFWNKVYIYGLGEFAYLNRLSPRSLGNFKANVKSSSLSKCTASSAVPKFIPNGRYLTGIGGGKDSLVAWELLKALGVKQTAFACESPSHNNSLRRDVITSLGDKSLIVVRKPDQKLEKMRSNGTVFRGHTPMSVVIAWVAIFCAYLKKYDGFFVANESSSNEYNLTWRGVKVNHQWTKTVTFEKAMGAFLNHIGVDVSYMSVVRPMNELTITALFSKMEQYHDVFFSCNKSQVDAEGNAVRWCGKCAKCASASLLLAPFVSPEKLERIIGVNMYNNSSNVNLFAELAGFSGNKPFECVCTKEEAASILAYLHDNDEYNGMTVVSELWKQFGDGRDADSLNVLLNFKPTAYYPRQLSEKLSTIVKQKLG